MADYEAKSVSGPPRLFHPQPWLPHVWRDVLYLRLCLLLSEDAVPVIPVGTGDRLLFFASAIVGRRVPLQFGAPLAWGARRLGSGLAFRSALVACHRFS